MTPDGSDNVVVLDPGQDAQLNVAAVEGHRYRITMPYSDIGYWDQVLRVSDPSGGNVIDVNAGAGGAWYIEGAQAGTYKVVLDPNGEYSGTVTTRVEDLSVT